MRAKDSLKKILLPTWIVTSLVLLVLSIPSTGPVSAVPCCPPYYEVISHVTSIVDGDTLWIWIENIVVELDPSGEIYEGTSEKVRFGGGIDAPEYYEPGGSESTAFIANLIPPGTRVYIDLDNLAMSSTGRRYRGTYERLISVLYFELDGWWVNVNAELLRWGMEAFPGNDWDQYTWIPSEFSVYDWPLYDNSYPYVSGFIPLDVGTSPGEKDGLPGENITFTVTVTNICDEHQSYNLTAEDNTGWSLELENELLEVPAGENRTTTLTVTISENAELGTKDNITVTATSITYPTKSDNSSCIARVIPSRAELSLVTIYKYELDLCIHLEDGSKLVVKFYTYMGDNQGENVIWANTTPAYVSLLENVPHPLGEPVENSVLVLTTDNTDEVLLTIASFTVHQSDLRGRDIEILVAWFAHPELHDEFRAEIVDILVQWFKAPP